jgi:hypothetical protein
MLVGYVCVALLLEFRCSWKCKRLCRRFPQVYPQGREVNPSIETVSVTTRRTDVPFEPFS